MKIDMVNQNLKSVIDEQKKQIKQGRDTVFRHKGQYVPLSKQKMGQAPMFKHSYQFGDQMNATSPIEQQAHKTSDKFFQSIKYR